MQADYSREKDLAIAVVVQASRLCVKIQSRLVSDLTIEKKDNSPVTVADYASQALIIAKLSSAFPEYPFIAEESGNELSSQPEVLEQVFQEVKPFLPELQDGEAGLKQLTEIIERGQTPIAGSRRWWTLDPIDGTQGFLRRGQYAVALALMEDNQPVVGVLGCPELPAKLEPEEGPKGCIMAAVKGGNAFVFTLEEAEGLAREEIVSGERLQTSQISDPSQAILTESYERRQNAQDLNVLIANELGVKVEPVRIDSQCKYAIVARGESSLYLRLSSLSYKEKIWDHAAGVLIVEEAGGRVTDFLGKSLDWSLGRTLRDSLGIVCSNGLLHDQVLAAIQKIDPVAVLSASKK